jgi:sugar/nucleoside kinase (ribokinase family)
MELADVIFVADGSLSMLGLTSVDVLANNRWVIWTAGKRGASGLEPGRRERVYQAAFSVEAVDTTGAGDCFHAALLAAKLWGASLKEALAFASAAAAIMVRHEGARGGLPTRDEVEAFLDRAGKGA